MSTENSMGFPPPQEKKWNEEYTKSKSVWSQYVKNLEGFQDSMIGDALPAVGSDIDVNYKIDTTADFVTTKFQVLGYNGSIPQFIKYKNGSETIYVPSTVSEGGKLATVTANSTKAYTDKSFTSDVKGTITAVDGTFTYGSTNSTWGTTATTNGSFSVPMIVTVGGTEYAFAGYNMTIMSRYGLRTSVNGTAYGSIYFSKTGSFPINRWTTSEIRSWMNSTGSSTGATWCSESGSTETTSVPGLLDRFEPDMLGSVSKAINRTFVYGGSVDHAVDMFWLPGWSNINASEDVSFPDCKNDTCKFSTAFEDTDASRIRYYMSDTGESSGVDCRWQLRSAYSGDDYDDYYVGYVYSGGDVYYDDANGYDAVLPICLIG